MSLLENWSLSLFIAFGKYVEMIDMPFYNARCDSCRLLNAIGKLEYYESAWARVGNMQEVHNEMVANEEAEDVPSYSSWKRHIDKHVKRKITDDGIKSIERIYKQREVDSANILDEIKINLTTCRNQANAATRISKTLLEQLSSHPDPNDIRNLTALNNSITKQLQEIRNTLKMIHDLRKELDIEPDDHETDQRKFSVILDEEVPLDVLVKLRKRMKEEGLVEY